MTNFFINLIVASCLGILGSNANMHENQEVRELDYITKLDYQYDPSAISTVNEYLEQFQKSSGAEVLFAKKKKGLLIIALRTADERLVIHGQSLGPKDEEISITAYQRSKTLERVGFACVQSTYEVVIPELGKTQSTVQRIHGSVFKPAMFEQIKINVFVRKNKVEEFYLDWLKNK
jgi:glutaredoxin-related protein